MSEACAVCGKKMGGLLGLVSADERELHKCREQGVDVPTPICHACSLPYVQQAKNAFIAQTAKPSAGIPDIDIFTFNPFTTGADYVNLGLVTAHVALGTGLFTEFVSSFNDLFGEQSSVYDDKMREATQACLNKLKLSAANMGASAVIGVQITYNELTAGHGMIMVCMAGTAINRPSDGPNGNE